MLIANLDLENPNQRAYNPLDHIVQLDEFPYFGYGCVCGKISRYVGSAWEVYREPGSSKIFRCECGIEIKT